MLESLKKTYQGKRVFLTGHTGFKGAWMLKTLNIIGAEVMGYALAPQNVQDLYNLIDGDKLCHSNLADLRDSSSLSCAILDFQPDFIFHLAAQPLVRLSYETPSETFEINAIGTAHLLDSVRLLEKECSIVLITTDKVYHNNEWDYPYRENDKLGGYDPYSASKACAELIIDSYRNSFFGSSSYGIHRKGIAVARAGNVIGGGDWSKDRLIPDIAKAYSKGQKVMIRNPASVRPWQHVLEPITGYLYLGQKLSQNAIAYSSAFNFGPNSEDALSVLDMVHHATEIWGDKSYEIIDASNQPHEAGLLMLDISRAIKLIGWNPKYTAKEAIANTIYWYINFYKNPEIIDEITHNQILDFLLKEDDEK